MITDTAFVRNPHYHLPSDRPETLDYERMAQVVNGTLGAVLHGAQEIAGSGVRDSPLGSGDPRQARRAGRGDPVEGLRAE